MKNQLNGIWADVEVYASIFKFLSIQAVEHSEFSKSKDLK